MPTSGPWMTGVQRVFGFVFLALAVWMLSRIVPGPLALALYGVLALAAAAWAWGGRSEEHTSELQSLMRISYAVFCLKKKKQQRNHIRAKTPRTLAIVSRYTVDTHE